MSFDFLDQPVCRQIATALLHFLWQGAALLALLEVLLIAGRKLTTNQRYLASMVTLALMVACPATTLLLTTPDEATSVAAEMTAVAQDASARSHIANSNSETIPDDRTHTSQQTLPAVADSVWQELARWRPGLLLAWVLGVTFLGVRLLLGWCGQVWVGHNRRRLPPKWTQHVRIIAGRLGLPESRVYVSDRVAEAIAVGFWRPVVLIPAAWMAGLPATTLEAVIAHELAHLRRWDLWANLFQRLAETLLFYHPAVWWVSRRATMEREMCCDELAVAATGRRLDYARALEAIAATLVAPPTGSTLAVSFSGARQMKVLTRVRNVLGLSVQTRSGLAWPVCMLALAVPVSLSIGVTGSARAADSSATKLTAADGEPRPGPRDGEGPPPRGPRDGEGGPRPGPPDGGPKGGPRDGDAPRKPGPRDGEGKKPGPRDGEGGPKSGPRDGGPKEGPRDGGPKEGPRDGGPKDGPRDGDAPRKPGPRDGDMSKSGPNGEKPKPGPREGDGAGKKGPREGDGEKPRPKGEDAQAAEGAERKTRRVFEAYDANRDNEVSFSEWVDMRSGVAESGPRSTAERERFGSFDRDDDGVLSFKEFALSRGEGPAKPQSPGKPLREGETKSGPREGDRPTKPGPREGGPREGEREKPAPKDGGEGEKRGPREAD